MIWGMQIELGPCSPGSARAWVEYATSTLELLRALPEGQLPAHALDSFTELLEQWRPIAMRPEPFRWSAELPSERVQYLLHALFVAGTVVETEAESGRAELRPAAADEFHIVLVHEALAALEHGNDADVQFVEQMRNVWDIARRD